MPQQIYVKPAEGLIVRQPHRNQMPIPAYGATVPRNSFWLRRLRDGDVVEITETAFEKAKAKALKDAEPPAATGSEQAAK